MDCTAAQNACHAAIDGEITAEDRAALALHCRGCPDCDAYVRAMTSLCDSLAGLRDATNAVGAPVKVRKSHKAAPFPRWIGGVAAAIALMVGAVAIMRQHEPSPATRDTIVASPSASPRFERSIAQVAMAGESADRYVPVAQQSTQPNVHVFVLFDQPTQRATDQLEGGLRNPSEEPMQ